MPRNAVREREEEGLPDRTGGLFMREDLLTCRCIKVEPLFTTCLRSFVYHFFLCFPLLLASIPGASQVFKHAHGFTFPSTASPLALLHLRGLKGLFNLFFRACTVLLSAPSL